MSEIAMATKYGQIQTEHSDIELSAETKELLQKVAENKHDAKLWFDLSQSYKAQSLCREAVDAMSVCISLDPFNAQAYRFRGHYYINIGCFHEASADLVMASRLAPTDWAVWYHLGLSFYLAADYARADWAFSECLRLSESFESVVDAVNWLWMTRMYLGQPERAAEALERVKPNMHCDEHEYYNRCMVFGGYADPESMLVHARTLDELLSVSEAYGIAAYYELTGNLQRADEIFDELAPLCDGMWSAFAAHAVRARQARRKASK